MSKKTVFSGILVKIQVVGVKNALGVLATMNGIRPFMKFILNLNPAITQHMCLY